MRTITIFSNKGGSGRTVVTMALAAGFLAQGMRVAVMDCSDLVGCNATPLRAWTEQIANTGVRQSQLRLIECWSRENVEDGAAASRTDGYEILLIDTSARILEPQIAALNMADLIVAPAIGPLEAKRINEGISKHIDIAGQLFGLVNGCQRQPGLATETRKAFDHRSVFKSELPWADALSEQVLFGDLSSLVTKLACQSDAPGYARFRSAQTAWVAVQRLTFEIEWLLDGQRLENSDCSRSIGNFGRKSVA